MKLNTKALNEVPQNYVLAAGVYYVVIDKVEVRPQRNKAGNNLFLVMRVEDPTVTLPNGEVIQNNGNITLFRHISLVPTDKYDPDRVIKELAVACGIPDDAEEVTTTDLMGRRLMAKVKHRPAEDGYPESNDVTGFAKLD